jgi:hypothetical protein
LLQEHSGACSRHSGCRDCRSARCPFVNRVRPRTGRGVTGRSKR